MPGYQDIDLYAHICRFRTGSDFSYAWNEICNPFVDFMFNVPCKGELTAFWRIMYRPLESQQVEALF